MRIFISYASEDRSAAEAVVLSLRGAGHQVFFDRTDLPAGETYDVRILDAIEAIAAYAIDNNDSLLELDVNPLLVTPDAAIAVDAFIRVMLPAAE